MYLLADSGATKTDWILFDDNGDQNRFRTPGINPMIQSEVEIRTGPMKDFTESLGNQKVSHLFYYGAGLRTQDKADTMRKLMGEALPGTQLEIHHDLLGAARATCGHEAGIACILGTGSNSCWYDGEKIIGEVGGHGYILGDEGSGADLGKHLLKGILDLEFSDDYRKKVEKFAGKTIWELRNEAYQHPRPNYFFANFSRLIGEDPDDPAMQGLVLGRFTTFLGKTVLKYAGYTDIPIHFIGSVAKVFEKTLVQACDMFNLKMGRIVQAPAETLVDYHLAGMKK